MPFEAERLQRFVASVFAAIGILPQHAEVSATRLIEADLRGRGGHGLIRVRPWARRVMAGGINTRPDIRVEHETAASALIDGDNGIGPAVVSMATEKAITLAEQSGVAWVGTRRSNHAGAGGVYTALARERGLIALYMAVAAGNSVPPWGGVEPLMGTNPLAVSIPAGDEVPFELDIATTVASHGSIREKALAGEPLPEGWVVGRDGRPITDPARADEGTLLPMGGHKGAGLDFMVGALAGVLNGAAFGSDVVADSREPRRASNTGQALLVLRPDLFMPGTSSWLRWIGNWERSALRSRPPTNRSGSPARGLPPPRRNVAATGSRYRTRFSMNCVPSPMSSSFPTGLSEPTSAAETVEQSLVHLDPQTGTIGNREPAVGRGGRVGGDIAGQSLVGRAAPVGGATDGGGAVQVGRRGDRSLRHLSRQVDLEPKLCADRRPSHHSRHTAVLDQLEAHPANTGGGERGEIGESGGTLVGADGDGGGRGQSGHGFRWGGGHRLLDEGDPRSGQLVEHHRCHRLGPTAVGVAAYHPGVPHYGDGTAESLDLGIRLTESELDLEFGETGG